MFHTPALSKEIRTAVHPPGKTYTTKKLKSSTQDIQLDHTETIINNVSTLAFLTSKNLKFLQKF